MSSIFGEVNGLPVHSLVVHAAVVFVPLSALLAVGFLVPRWRRVLRWPLVVLTAVATVSVYVAKESGEHLKRAMSDQIEGNVTGTVVDRHQEWGDKLFIAMIVFFVIAVLAVIISSRSQGRVLGGVAAVILVVVACVSVWLAYETGEQGAKARWNPDGSVSYTG